MTSLPFCLPPDISAETFLNDYWQKKPLLIKNGLPSLAGMFEPADILELATFDDVTARLITQVGNPANNQHHQWTLQNSPFTQKDFTNLPEFWTLLVQNMEQWSPELANLWHAFDFIPQWQRDDIMVSYALKGGSVGRHFDEYDVFLAQGYGSRRWQLGRMCDENTEFMAGQPIRLLNEMGEIVFDDLLEAGDVLYVPPRLSHYGVAQNDCLTFSFGFRRPNLLQILDNLTDVATHQERLSTPLLLNQGIQKSGELGKSSILAIKQQLLALLNTEQGDTLLTQAIAETVSKRQYDVLVNTEIYHEEDILEILQNGATISQDLASRILYLTSPLTLYINGMLLNSAENFSEFSHNELIILAKLADGEILTLMDIENAEIKIVTLNDWLENGWIILNENG